MKGPKVPAVIPPAFTPQAPISSRAPDSGPANLGFNSAPGAGNMQSPANTKKKTLIGGAA